VTAENIERIARDVITELLETSKYFHDAKFQELEKNIAELVKKFFDLWNALRKDRTGKTAWTEVTCYEGSVWVENIATGEKITLSPGETVVVIGAAGTREGQIEGTVKKPETIKKTAVELTEAATKAKPMYRAAKKLIPSIANLMMRGASTFLIEPAASDEDISPVTSDNTKLANILGRDGHGIRVKSYVAEGDIEAKIAAIKTALGRTLPEFLKASPDLKTRLVIRIALKDGEDWKAITEAIKTELLNRDVDAATIANQVRFVNAQIGDAKHLNTVIDTFTDVTMMECDRYESGQYEGGVPEGLGRQFKSLLAVSITNFSEFSGLTVEQILSKIFAGTALRIRAIDWKSIDEWKARNDEIIKSL
jgi:hypothetical protein